MFTIEWFSFALGIYTTVIVFIIAVSLLNFLTDRQLKNIRKDNKQLDLMIKVAQQAKENAINELKRGQHDSRH